MLHNIYKENAVNCILKRCLTAVGPFSHNKSQISFSCLIKIKNKNIYMGKIRLKIEHFYWRLVLINQIFAWTLTIFGFRCSIFSIFLCLELKVISAIKHWNIGEEIIIYTHRAYILLLKLEKTKYILTFTLYSYLPWHADFASDFCSIHISVRGYTNMMVVT